MARYENICENAYFALHLTNILIECTVPQTCRRPGSPLCLVKHLHWKPQLPALPCTHYNGHRANGVTGSSRGAVHDLLVRRVREGEVILFSAVCVPSGMILAVDGQYMEGC